MNSNFQDLLNKAQSGDSDAVERIYTEFLPLIKKYGYIAGKANEDLLSELYISAYLCILRFSVDQEDMEHFLEEADRRGAL